MKKIIILSIVFLSLLGVTSCDKDEIETYSSTDNIYFSAAVFPVIVQDGSFKTIDSTGFSFGYDNASIVSRTIKIPIRVQGRTSASDRMVRISVDPLSTAVVGTDFELPPTFMIRAGQVIDTLSVKVLRTGAIKAKALTMVLNLEENEFFTTKMKSKVINTLTKKTLSFTRFKVSFDDILGQPIGWSISNYGVFTTKKLFLMSEQMNLDPKIFNQPAGAGSIGLTVADMQYYQNFMKRYLAAEKAAGRTVYEDDGTEMFFP